MPICMNMSFLFSRLAFGDFFSSMALCFLIIYFPILGAKIGIICLSNAIIWNFIFLCGKNIGKCWFLTMCRWRRQGSRTSFQCACERGIPVWVRWDRHKGCWWCRSVWVPCGGRRRCLLDRAYGSSRCKEKRRWHTWGYAPLCRVRRWAWLGEKQNPEVLLESR